MSTHFSPIKVKSVENTTDDSVVVSFDIPQEHKEEFRFTQGQYLTLKAKIEGEDVQRSYSLCSSPLDEEWKVAIKKVPFGKFSTYANETLEAGTILDVMPPNGKFFVDVNPDAKRNYLAFAAGSGITPILSIIKTHLESEPKSSFKLFFTNKNLSSIMLKEELEGLKNRFMDRFEIFYFLTKEKRNIEFFNGRLSTDKLEIIFKTIVDLNEIDHHFICGPEEMIFTVRDFLLENGAEKEKLHFELFTSSSDAKKEFIEDSKELYQGKTTHITVIEGGKTLEFDMPQASDNILDAALNNSADLPFACKGGVCCTCKAKLLEGEVNQLVNYGLEEDEVEAGYILTCQAIPVSDNIVVDYDA